MGWYLFWIASFVIVMYAIGVYHYRNIEDSDEYLISSWNVGFWPIVGTVVATWTGSAAFVGAVGLGYDFGISGFTRFALPAVFVSLLLCLVFASRIRRTKLYTLPDVFDERFGRPTGILPAILQAFIYSVPTLALQIVAMGYLFQTLFEIPLWISLVISWAIISGYTLLGGLPSVILTDSIQSIVLLVGIVLMGVATWVFAGGIGEIAPAVPESHFTFLGADPLDTIFFALSIGPFYLVWQSTWQRFYASRTEDIARWGGFTGFFFAGVVLGIISIAIGVSARAFLQGEIAPDAVFYTVLQEVLPPVLGGILAMGLMAALVSGGDSFIMQGASNLTRDIYNRYLNPEATSDELLRVSRWSVAIIAVLGLAVSFAVTDIITLYSYALKWIGVTLVIPFLAIMFWRRTTKQGIIWSMVLALTATILWEVAGRPLGLNEALIGYAVMAVSLVSISLLTRHAPEEQVVALWTDNLKKEPASDRAGTQPARDDRLEPEGTQ